MCARSPEGTRTQFLISKRLRIQDASLSCPPPQKTEGRTKSLNMKCRVPGTGSKSSRNRGLPVEVPMPTIGAAVNEVTKNRFESVASARGMTASRLAASLINDFLKQGQADIEPDREATLAPSKVVDGRHGVRSEQVYVRLDPYYFEELGRLARERDWYRGTYLANLFHAHADRRPVLCQAEINAVRQVARQLADMGRNINQIAKKLNASPGSAPLALGADFELVRMLVEIETTTVKDLIRANLRGWGVSDGQA